MKMSSSLFVLFSFPVFVSATTDASRSAPDRSKTVVQVRMSDIGLGNPLDEDVRLSRTELPAVEEAGLPAKELQVSFARGEGSLHDYHVSGTMPYHEAGSIKDLLEEAHHAGIDLPSGLKTKEEIAALKAGAEALSADKAALKAKILGLVDAISAPEAERFGALARFFGEHFGGPILRDYQPVFSETPVAGLRLPAQAGIKVAARGNGGPSIGLVPTKKEMPKRIIHRMTDDGEGVVVSDGSNTIIVSVESLLSEMGIRVHRVEKATRMAVVSIGRNQEVRDIRQLLGIFPWK